MTDWFWSIATSDIVLAGMAVLFVAALIFGHLPVIGKVPALAPYVVLSRFLAYLFLAMLAAGIDHRLCDETAALRQAKIDLAFSELQLDAQKHTAETAERLRLAAETKANLADQKVADYEIELSKRPHDSRCTLTDDDVRWLRSIAN